MIPNLSYVKTKITITQYDRYEILYNSIHKLVYYRVYDVQKTNTNIWEIYIFYRQIIYIVS